MIKSGICSDLSDFRGSVHELQQSLLSSIASFADVVVPHPLQILIWPLLMKTGQVKHIVLVECSCCRYGESQQWWPKLESTVNSTQAMQISSCELVELIKCFQFIFYVRSMLVRLVCGHTSAMAKHKWTAINVWHLVLFSQLVFLVKKSTTWKDSDKVRYWSSPHRHSTFIYLQGHWYRCHISVWPVMTMARTHVGSELGRRFKLVGITQLVGHLGGWYLWFESWDRFS